MDSLNFAGTAFSEGERTGNRPLRNVRPAFCGTIMRTLTLDDFGLLATYHRTRLHARACVERI